LRSKFEKNDLSGAPEGRKDKARRIIPAGLFFDILRAFSGLPDESGW
jgi:hypothetical protein